MVSRSIVTYLGLALLFTPFSVVSNPIVDGELYCHSNSSDVQTTLRVRSTFSSRGVETLHIFLNERDYRGVLAGLRNSESLPATVKDKLQMGEWLSIEIPDATEKCARSKEGLFTISCTQSIDGLEGLSLALHKSPTQPSVVKIPVRYRGFLFSLSHITHKAASFGSPYDATFKEYQLSFSTQILVDGASYGDGGTKRVFTESDCVFLPN